MSDRILTEIACDNIIQFVANKTKSELHLIKNRLMSTEDFYDLRSNKLSAKELELHVKVWIRKGIPDYANGNTEPFIA